MQLRRRATLLSLAMAVPLFVAGCLSSYEKGSKLYEAGEYENARTEAEEGLQQAPDDPQLNLLMAKALVAEENYREAESYAKKAFEAESTRGPGGRVLGKIHWELGRALKAVEVWRDSRAIDPDYVSKKDFKRALVAAVGTADSSHKYERALELRKELAEIAPDHPEVSAEVLQETRKKHAEDLVQRGEYEDAAAVYATLVENADQPGRFAYERGRLLLRLKRPDEATNSFEQYVGAADQSDRIERTLDVARRSKDLNAPRVAVEYYERAIDELGEDPTFRRSNLRLTVAKLLFEVDEGKRARQQIEKYLEDMRELRGVPLDAEVYRTAAEAASESGRNSFAIELLERALEKAPPSWSIASRLAQQYAVQARQQEAERVLNTYIDRANDPAKALANAAEWAKQRRNYDLAKTFYERLVETDPDRSNGWLELGKLYAKLGQVENMKDALDTFVERHGDDRHDLVSVASVYRDQQLYRDAERVLELVRQRNPKSLHVVDRLAELYRDWGKPVRIEKVYKRWIQARGGSASDYQLVGERLIRRQKYRQALPFFEKAAEKGVTEAWLQIADIYKRQRRELDMKEALETYVEKASNRTRALRAALDRYRGTSLTRETTKILEELIDREPGVRSHYKRLGEAYLAQGRRQEAFRLWRQYVEQAGDQIEALSKVAYWFEKSGHSGYTLEFYREWMRDEEPDPELYRLMGDAYMKLAPARWRRRRPSSDLVDDARDQAKRLYRRYLREADPSATELTNFANKMRESRMWSTAARAYQNIVDSVSSGSEIRLHYGESMLHLGDVDRADEAFRTYYEARGKGAEQARQIADHLVEFGYLERAEPYLDRMFDSEKGSLIQEAFVELTKVYQHTDRGDRISELVSDYLNRAPNPAKARQTSVSVLERRGLYAEAAEQIERIREFQGNVLGFRRGANLFRSGQFEESQEAFEQHASESPYAGSVWVKIGAFYEKHAQPERAMEAYDRAVETSPDDANPRERRGRFRLLRGQYEAGNTDFREALDRANSKGRDEIRKTWIETLREIGRFERAGELARTALKSASKNRDYFLRTLAEHELITGDQSHVNRMVQRLKSSSLPVQQTVGLLVEHGHRSEAADLIENELGSGNFTAAGRAMVNRPDIFTRLGGLDALKRAARPLLKQDNTQASMRAELGEYFVRQGRYADGIAYLRSAMEDGRSAFQPVLAHAYASSGQPDMAADYFQRYLRKIADSQRSNALTNIGARYELAGEFDRFDDLLENLASDPAFGADALGLLIEQRAASGDLGDAIGRVRDELDDLSPADGELAQYSADQPDSADRVLKAIEGIAAAGYHEEAAALWEELPESVRERSEFRTFQLHLAAARGADDLSERVESALATDESSLDDETTSKRLEYARVLSVNGHYELAAETVRPLLESSDHVAFRNASLFLIRNAFLSEDRDSIRDLNDQLLETVSDDLEARTRIGRTLRQLGLDERAHSHLQAVASRAPTSENVREALGSALASGMVSESRKTLETFIRVVEQPLREVEGRWQAAVERSDREITELLLAPYEKTYPARLDGRLGRARLAFREGDVEEGRSLLVEYLETVEYRPRAAERVLEFLDRNDLPYETTRVVAPKLEETELTNQSRRYIGYGHLGLDESEKARQMLERAVEGAPDPGQAAIEIAEELFDRGYLEAAEHFGDLAVERAPDRPTGRLFRGLARLAQGDAEAGRKDVDAGVGSTADRSSALTRAGRAALKGGHPDIAAEYLEPLARTPNARQTGVLLPFRAALDTYIEAGHAESGVEFLENHFPRTAAGGGLDSLEVRPQLVGLYRQAGQADRAFEVYHRGITRTQIRNPDGGGLPVYLNNLAYVYSTTNRNIEEGFDLVRRALASSNRRQSSYIDTLGWLHYRRGELVKAETYVRRSLRTASGSPTGLVELYEHLATLRDEQGFDEEAFWLRRFYKSLERH